MGKKQHQKDKLWLTTTEWKTIYGGKKANSKGAKCLRQPFNYCSLKYVPALNPCCTKEGILFDYGNILEFIKKNHINPLTNKKLKVKDLLKLKIHENVDGEMHCPITYKQFNDSTRIVAVPGSGNVFSLEGLQVNNVKGDEWFDPLSEDKFNKSNLILLQDPENPDRFNMNAFYRVENKEEKPSVGTTIKMATSFGMDVLKEVQDMTKKQKTISESQQKETTSVYKDKINESNISTGMMAASFTSTSAPIAYNTETIVRTEDAVRYERVSQNGFVRLVTNFGHINLELFCQIAPRACENFIQLCKTGYYDKSSFHRLIKHFVLQGGDPTGSGKGGQSIWGKPFKDEICAKFSHDARGVLSMANAGPDSNKSQFFIVLRPAKHLDKKHTIFGKIVGGMKVLDDVEEIESDNQDRPIEPIEIVCTEVFVDPFEKVDEQICEERLHMNEPKIDTSLLPRTRKEEDALREKQMQQGTCAGEEPGSKRVGRFMKKRTLADDDSFISEYSAKVARQEREHTSISSAYAPSLFVEGLQDSIES